MARTTKILASALIGLLLLDGVLTYLGVEVMRLSEEGNPVMRHAMSIFGVLAALIISRVVAIACMFGIIRSGTEEVRTNLLLTMLIGVVFSISIVPWVVLILEHL